MRSWTESGDTFRSSFLSLRFPKANGNNSPGRFYLSPCQERKGRRASFGLNRSRIVNKPNREQSRHQQQTLPMFSHVQVFDRKSLTSRQQSHPCKTHSGRFRVFIVWLDRNRLYQLQDDLQRQRIPIDLRQTRNPGPNHPLHLD